MSTLKSVLLAFLIMLAPIKPVLLTVFGLVGMDLITGLLVARKKGLPITSKGLKITVVKLFVYELAITMAYYVGQYLTGPDVAVLHIVSGIVGMTELKSVLENLDALTDGQLMPAIVNAIQSIVSNNTKQ